MTPAPSAVAELRRSPVYRAALWLSLGLAAWVLVRVSVPLLQQPRILYYDDYVEYWSAGRLNLTRGNPYDPAQLEALQIQVGRLEHIPLMMWNPPWTLALVMPFAALGYPGSRLLWLLTCLGSILLSADVLWHQHGYCRRQRWVVWAVALMSGPALHSLKLGQITPLLLAGLVVFLWCAEHRHWWWAGVMLFLLTIKPHLLYLVGGVAFLWVVDNRRFGVIFGAMLAGVVTIGISWWINPSLLAQYLWAAQHYPPVEWLTPTLGGLLRAQYGPGAFYFQFLPTCLGGIWGVVYWLRHRADWAWAEHAPLLVMVSLTTAAYGWNHDLMLALAAVVPLLLRVVPRLNTGVKWLLIALYALVNVVVLFAAVEQTMFWWLAPWLLGWCVVLDRLGTPTNNHQGGKLQEYARCIG